MRVTIRQRKDRPGWWVFVSYQGRRMKRGFGNDKKQAKEFATKLDTKLRWAEMNGEPVAMSQPDQSDADGEHFT